VYCFLILLKLLERNNLGRRNLLKAHKSFSWAAAHWEDLGLGELVGKSPEKGANLLSFGSGSPRERVYEEEAGYCVTAFDIYPARGVDLVADGHGLPFKSQVFHLVTAFQVLEHLQYPWIAVREIARVLRPGGRFVGSVAFLKSFHRSYFHMTHWGVSVLLEQAGFIIDHIYGGQNIYSRLLGEFFPLGPKGISYHVYELLNKVAMGIKRGYRRLKHGEDYYTSETNKYDPKFQFSLDEFEALKFGPSVIFSATKMIDCGK
jgi:SAM-dependent methyltransferase